MKNALDGASDVEKGRISICFVIASIVTDRAGTEGHLLRLIRSLDREIFRPVLVVLQRSKWTDSFSDPSIPLIVLGFQSFTRPSSWGSIAKLAWLLRQYQVQVVETHFPEAHFIGAIAAKIAGVPVVIGSRRDLVTQYSKKELALCRLSNLFTNIHLANSHAVANIAKHIERRSHIEVIHNGVCLDAFARSLNGDAEHLHESMQTKRLVTLVANLTPIKNIKLLIEAASRISDRFGDVYYAILGIGPEESRLRSCALDCGIQDRIVFAGRVHNVREYLLSSEIGCLTSNAEGMSNSILEYMASALPVIATDVGGASEAIVDGVTGFLVEKNDVENFAAKLEILLSDPARACAMGQAGRKRVEDCFSLESQVRSHEQLYGRLIQEALSVQSPLRDCVS